ncbi:MULTISPECIES: hypothetical protein [Bradyrhizobium]|uniref:Uncharacterized protein n=1 Tax=Bradyrhizobium elkanii TaxID=29448 RepID=A0A4U6RY72_BRAEL|nr:MULTISPECIES: hypothetical protein [Bradyrhizobium]MTV18305.1 hypothetical protein [Bradyrhizobium sp. BR2003]TKV80197.1 hypothetical protein FDV58_18415 [Bradyrhizobium elkanii]
MDFNAIGSANAGPEPEPPEPFTDAPSFEQRLSGAHASAPPQHAAPPVLQGDAYSPYLGAGHPYSPYLDAGHPYSPYLDLAHPSTDLGWEDNSHTPTADHIAPELESFPQPLSQQTIAQAIEAHPDIDQDLIWQNVDAGPSGAGPSPSHAGPSYAGLVQARPSHAGPSHARPLQAGPSEAGPSEATPPELSGFRMVEGRLAKDYWVFTGQTATDAEIDMLERSGVKPSREQPSKVFTLLGVPHTAEWRDEGFIRLTPSLDPTLWPEEPAEDRPADSEEDPPAR